MILFKALFLSFTISAKLPSYLLSVRCWISASLSKQLDWFYHCFFLVPFIACGTGKESTKAAAKWSKCKISSRSVSRYYLELLTITFITGILPFGRESPLFRGPLNFWKFAGGEDSATILIKFFFIGNYPFFNLLLGCIIFNFSSALGFSIFESQAVISFSNAFISNFLQYY